MKLALYFSIKQESELCKRHANKNGKNYKGQKREGSTHQKTITCQPLSPLPRMTSTVSFTLIIS